MPLLHELSERESLTCHLGCLDGNEGVYLAKVDPRTTVLVVTWEGKRVGLKSSAMGKVFLAWRPREERQALIDAAPFLVRTHRTIVDPAKFDQHIEIVRRQGFAFDDEEDVVGIRCVAAPVFNPHGKVNYSISVSGAVSELSDARLPDLTAAVISTAQRLSASIGAPGTEAVSAA